MKANPLADLSDELIRRDATPIDAYEVAAVLESLGVTDVTAQQRFGATSVFTLSHSLFKTLRLNKPLRVLPTLEPPRRERGSEWVIGFLLLLPSLLTLLFIRHISVNGRFDTTAVLALCWGVSCGIFAANCCTLGITRRVSFLLSVRNMKAVRRFILIAGGISAASIATIGLLTAYLLMPPGITIKAPFVLGFTGMGVIWILAGLLSIFRKTCWLPIAMAVGIAITIAIDAAVAIMQPAILVVGALYGFTITVSILILVIWHATRPDTPHESHMKLPPPAYLATEALPYVGYGIAYACFIMLPHAVALFYAAITGGTIESLTSFEAGMTFALLPSIMGIGFLDLTQRAFWREMPHIQSKVAGWRPEQFNRWALQFHNRRIARYSLVLAVICAGSAVLFEWLRINGALGQWLNGANMGQVSFVFYTSLAAFTALAMGNFNGMFFLALNRTTPITIAMLAGSGVTLVLSLLLGWLAQIYLISVAFLAGALVMLLLSWRAVRSLMRSADYYVSAAFF